MNGELRETDWDTAMNQVVARSKSLLAESGPGAFGFYTSGQLFLEDYYTLSIMARAGIGTNHIDGNTRLCTATAGEALKESFGCDGQPGSYSDVDHTDTICCYGHNVAETQTVLWMRHPTTTQLRMSRSVARLRPQRRLSSQPLGREPR